VSSIRELVKRGVYFTTVLKCGKTGYGVKAGSINECSQMLAIELGLFPNLEVIMLMGDVAIKSLNRIAKRLGEAESSPPGRPTRFAAGGIIFRKSVFSLPICKPGLPSSSKRASGK
jgi:uracil-DNA glycosylase